MLIIKFLSLIRSKKLYYFYNFIFICSNAFETFSIALSYLIDTIINGNLNYNNIFFDYFIIETSEYFNISILFIISILILLLFIAKSIFLSFSTFNKMVHRLTYHAIKKIL